MSEPETPPEAAPGKKSKGPLIIGALLALVGSGVGFYATWSGMVLGAKSPDSVEMETDTTEKDKVYFVPVDPLVISLGAATNANHLRFRADLEVPAKHKAEVEQVLPRVVDVLNSYLRALEPSDLEQPAALTRLRAQMLRRVQVVVGQDRINDLLVMEFVLN